MPNILLQQLENALPKGMQIPEELRQLYQWIEDNGYYSENEGIRYGYLYPQDKLRESWKEEEREGGTDIAFSVLKNIDREEVLENYYKKHPLDHSDSGIVARYTGMTKDQAEIALGLLEYNAYLANYHPKEKGPKLPTKIEDYQYESSSVIAEVLPSSLVTQFAKFSEQRLVTAVA